ncbi:hypothetical protein [Sulfuracidifex metallicus]|uniref:hypothetical protein n=1 Tax=Sulfuracidifex metallicus TaxID=47303 RepID=UPI0022751D0D|nr:hypothetical protein [Sulfuracidifex metallicus]MCY0849686.1 hypothetical protein [Sulfuracidifex metallicus]
MMDSRETAKEIARRMTRYYVRKTMAKYYTVWSTYPLMSGLLYILVHGINFEAFLVLLILYIIFTGLTFSKLFQALARAEDFKRKNSNRRRGISSILIFIVLIVIILFSYYMNYSLYLMSSGIYTFLVDAGVLMTVRGQTRYYDIIAVLTFSIAFIGSALFPYLFTPLFLLFSIAWIFAGYLSFLEVTNDV